MLKTKLQHPGILRALAAAGHGAQILITDGHYPASTKTKADVEKIYLNICPGTLSVTDLVGILADTIEIEAATVMAPFDGSPEPEIFQEFLHLLPEGIGLDRIGRYDFYDRCLASQDLCLVLVSADTRQYANILLTIGVCRH